MLSTNADIGARKKFTTGMMIRKRSAEYGCPEGISGMSAKRETPSESVSMTILRTPPMRSLTMPQKVMATIATAQAIAFRRPNCAAGKPLFCR